MKKGVKILSWVGVAVLLVVLWYVASPLFIDKTINEEIPVGSESGEGTVQEVSSDYEGNFMDADSYHKVSGSAKIISQEGKSYLRFEDFESTNGPDLYVYVAEDLNADSYISLGKLKGNVGNQNYEITEEIDFEQYDKVLIWCKAFSVLFGSAELEK